MDSDDEFPVPSYREREAISHYLNIEQEFMPHNAFYTQTCNAQHRRQAVSTMVRLCHGETIDAYIPYLAMNYFDRFISTNRLAELQGSSLIDKVHLVAICCYTLSTKMRTTHFTQKKYLMSIEANFNPEKIIKMEFRILSGLDWRMRPVTPFHFLDYYYPPFKRVGGFKRRSINEIIIQSQGEVYFTQFKPSDIAMSALLAATYLGYYSKFTSLEQSISISREVMNCYLEMVQLCRKRGIEIRSRSGDVISPSIVAGPSSLAEASGSHTRTTKSEELGKGDELQTQEQKQHSVSSTTQFGNRVLDNDDDEEENVASLTRRRRRERRDEAGETHKEVFEDETETKKQTEEQEKEATVSNIPVENDVEAGNEVREDKSEGASKEIVEAETRARDDNCKSEEIIQVETGTRDDKCEGPSEEIVEAESSRAREDKGKAVDEIREVEENEDELRRLRKGKGKAVEEICEEEEDSDKELKQRQRLWEEEMARRARLMSDLVTEEEAAPLRLMSFQLRWPVTVRPGEILDYIDVSLQTDDSRITSTRCPTTIRGTGNDPPLVTNRCQCTIL